MWSRKQDAGTTTETQEEEQPSRWSSLSTLSELTIGMTKVPWALAGVGCAWSRIDVQERMILYRQFLLGCSLCTPYSSAGELT